MAHRTRYILYILLALLLTVFIIVRLYLNVWLLGYVNNVLGNIEGYRGSVESITIDLYRSAYSINGLKLEKDDGNIPVPFIAIGNIDFSLQWKALFHGRIVSDVTLTKPVINFAVKEKSAQTGEDVDWTRPINDLVPIDINLVSFKGGTLTYQDFSSKPKVDIYIHNMQGEISNLRNVVGGSRPLPSTVHVSGESIGNGHLDISGRMNIVKKVPDMDLLIKLENVSLPALNSYSDAYASIDFNKGDFSLYSELIVKNGHVSGYIKPLAHDVSLVDLRKDSNPVKVAWEAIVAGVIEIFTNHSKDQFATKIPLEGDLKDIRTDNWSAIGNILYNAFIGALKKGPDPESKSVLVPSNTSSEPSH